TRTRDESRRIAGCLRSAHRVALGIDRAGTPRPTPADLTCNKNVDRDRGRAARLDHTGAGNGGISEIVAAAMSARTRQRRRRGRSQGGCRSQQFSAPAEKTGAALKAIRETLIQ